MSRTREEIRREIELALVEEMNVVNVITQGPPEKWVPIFVKELTNKLYNLVIDEITYSRRS